jgi:hypothetical protein
MICIKIYRFFDMTACTQHILGKRPAKFNRDNDGMCNRSLPRTIENVGYRLYKDNLFFPADVFNDLLTRTVTCCGNVKQN